MKKKIIKKHEYHYLTNRIFATCDVYFKSDCIKQAKYEIDGVVRNYIREEEIKRSNNEKGKGRTI